MKSECSAKASGLRSLIWTLAPVLLVLGVWEIAAQAVWLLRGVAFPTPWQTGVRVLELLQGDPLSRQGIYTHLLASLRRWLAGFAMAAAAGLTYGLLAGRSLSFERATARIPQLLLLVPGLAWIPVAILLFGIGERATVFMIAMAAFAPVAISASSGIRSVDIRFVRAAQMLGAGRGDLFFRVLLPAALPALLSGLRIGLGTGWRVLVAAEMVVGAGTGLGYAIIQSRWTLDYASSFACIVLICAIGLLFEMLLFRTLEKRTLARWRPLADKP